jgi:molybdopterin synthase catalytic subunit
MIYLSEESIDVESLVGPVMTPESGAVDVFVGITRNHSKGRRVTLLEYEAYEPMALKMMEHISRQASARWNIHRIAIAHRLGKVPVGEASVVIAVSSAHRAEAFEACRFLIDELKRVVPIWKREYFEDGDVEWSLSEHERPTTSRP